MIINRGIGRSGIVHKLAEIGAIVGINRLPIHCRNPLHQRHIRGTLGTMTTSSAVLELAI